MYNLSIGMRIERRAFISTDTRITLIPNEKIAIFGNGGVLDPALASQSFVKIRRISHE